MNVFEREGVIKESLASTTKNTFNIRYVALYLRKSRGEEDKDLEKHRHLLVEMCKENGWKYVEYTEIANSETIEFRPKFQRLLKDVESEMYDAVLVVDYQRLGRGEIEDQGKIKRIFRDSETFIVTPEKIYNLVDETDDLLVDVKGLLANQEYKSIKKNLLRGKKLGARLGKWTNGPAPFPYQYNPLIKGLEVDPDKIDNYNEAKYRVLEGELIRHVVFDFNNRGVPSPKGGLWHEKVMREILLSETHLGRIITNKVQGSAHKSKKTKPLKYLSREEWVVVENCHEAVKTMEEHLKLISIIKSDTPSRAKAGVYALSGLVYCGVCKKMMRYNVRSDGYHTNSIKACGRYDQFGNYCKNRGLPIKVINAFIEIRVAEYEKEIFERNFGLSEEKKQYLERRISESEAHLHKLNRALSRIKEMYELGDYTREEYEERKLARLKEIEEQEEDIAVLKSQINYDEEKRTEELKSVIQSFKDIWYFSTASENEKNRIAKRLISRIEYTHDQNNNVDWSIEFH